MSKRTLCLDFDGVIHSYSSGWKGPRAIPDAPVAGALEFIVRSLRDWQLAIYSSRSGHLFGRWAMRRWLTAELIKAGQHPDTTPQWWWDRICETAFADPWDDEVAWAAQKVVREIQWPRSKPPAFVSIDDRALTFTGTWPSSDSLKAFKPWNKGA